MRETPRTRFLCWIPVEGAVTALGYFQASITVAAILFALRQIITSFQFYAIDCITREGCENISRYRLEDIKYMSLLVLPLGAGLAVAVFLVVGVKKRRAGFVLTYFICGVLAALGLAGYWVCRLYENRRAFALEGAIDIFLVLCVYPLFLAMVFFVYRNIRLEKDPNNMIYNMLQENHHFTNDTISKDAM